MMYPFAKRRDDVEKYYHQNMDADPDCLAKAGSAVLSLLPMHSVRPLSWDAAYDAIPHNKNWGCPYVTSNPGVGLWYLEHAPLITIPEQLYPYILFWRGQQDGPESTKQRVVFGASKLSTIIEATLMYLS